MTDLRAARSHQRHPPGDETALTPPPEHHHPLPERPASVNTTLVLAPTLEQEDSTACANLLFTEETNPKVLSVTLTESPDQRRDEWATALETTPPTAAFITTNDPALSAENTTHSEASDDPLVTQLPSPGALTELGIKLTTFLSAREDANAESKICLHSLTTLLQYVDLKQTFRFIHVLNGRIQAVGASGHFHMDPTAHDARTINTLIPLFDAVLQYSDDAWLLNERS